MPGSTEDVLYDNIIRRGPDGDAIISGPNHTVQDLNVVHLRLQMDPVGVGAEIGAVDRDPLNQHSVGVVELEMDLRRVSDGDAED